LENEKNERPRKELCGRAKPAKRTGGILGDSEEIKRGG